MAAETFGEILKRLRAAKGLTQQQLADQVGLSQVHVARLETDLFEPKWGTVQRLAEILGVTCKAFEDTVKKKSAATKKPSTKK